MKKLREISLYEVILCIFVVLIHVLSGGVENFPKGSPESIITFAISRAIAFAVPAFIMSSAIKMSGKFSHSALNYPRFIKRRLLRVYLPFLFWAVIYYLYFVFYREYYPFNIVDMLTLVLSGNIAAPFYFIIVIMQFYILMPLWIKIFKSAPVTTAVPFALLITIISKYLTYDHPINNSLFTNYLVFWIAGCYIGPNFSKFTEMFSKFKKLFLLAAIIFTTAYIMLSYMEFWGTIGTFATELLKLLFCSASSITLLLYCHSVAKRAESGLCKGIMRIADVLSPTTFYVYLIHCLIIIDTEFTAKEYGISDIATQIVIKFFVAYILSFALSLIYCKIKKMITAKK